MTQRSSFDGDAAFRFGVREEMGFGVRLASPIRVHGGNGRITSSHGGINEKGTWGKTGSWWDYSGSIDGLPLGVMILSGSGNPETWSHSRDYGLLVANPFPVDIEKNRSIKTEIPAGRAFELSFGIVVHEGNGFDAARTAELIQLGRDF